MSDDPEYARAVEITMLLGKASVSAIQRRMYVDLGKAIRLIQEMVTQLIVCPKCYRTLTPDHTHRTYEEHDYCRNLRNSPSALPPRPRVWMQTTAENVKEVEAYLDALEAELATLRSMIARNANA